MCESLCSISIRLVSNFQIFHGVIYFLYLYTFFVLIIIVTIYCKVKIKYETVIIWILRKFLKEKYAENRSKAPYHYLFEKIIEIILKIFIFLKYANLFKIHLRLNILLLIFWYAFLYAGTKSQWNNVISYL